jgi:hypothetical protein
MAPREGRPSPKHLTQEAQARLVSTHLDMPETREVVEALYVLNKAASDMQSLHGLGNQRVPHMTGFVTGVHADGRARAAHATHAFACQATRDNLQTFETTQHQLEQRRG